MALVRIPPVRDGAGVIVPATVSVRLETADGQPTIGFGPSDLATEYTALALDTAALELPLTPQSAIALPGGAPTWYRIDIRTAHRRETYRVQVPDSAAPIDLSDLVAAAAIAPAALLAGRLLPPPADLPDGRWVMSENGAWVPVAVAPGGGVPEAPLSGGPYGRQGGAWVETDVWSLPAAKPLGGHRLVRADAAGDLDYASCADAASASALLGMTLGAGTAGAAVSVRRVGLVQESSWNWQPGNPVYLGLDGVPTQTLPPQAVCTLVVGVATGVTELFLAPREPIRLS